MAALLGRPEAPPINPALEAHHKMIKIRALSEAIYRARQEEQGFKSAWNIQRLLEQRKALRATLPPLRLVYSR